MTSLGSVGANSSPALIVENIIELTSEVVQINRAAVGGDSVIDQLKTGEIVESEVRF